MLVAGDVSVTYPDGWEEAAPDDTSVAAELRREGELVARVSIQLAFAETTDPELAAAEAVSSYPFGDQAESTYAYELQGVAGPVWRNDYPEYESPGGEGLPPAGAMVAGTDIVAIDHDGAPFLVRLTSISGELTDTELGGILDSVALADEQEG